MSFLRRRRATHFGNLKTLRKVHGFRRFDVSPVVLFTKLLIIGLLFLVATDSIEIRQKRAIPNQEYLILLDSSASMAHPDFNPNRLTAAKQISKNWLQNLPYGTRVGLVAFSQDIRSSVEPTTDKREITKEIEQLEIDYSRSGTFLDYAINYALDMAENNNTILLLTDGTEEVEKETIARLQSMNVSVHSFGIGKSESLKDIPEEMRNFSSNLLLNFTLMSKLSNQTGGRAFRVGNPEELSTSLEEATLEEVQIALDSGYYMLVIIALISISELIIYSKFGGL